MLFLDCRSEPRGLDLACLDARVRERFEISLDHQLFGAGIPALAEFRAAHAENCDLVLDAGGHASLRLSWKRYIAALSSPGRAPSRAPGDGKLLGAGN